MNELGYLDIEEHEYEIIRTRGRAYELLKEFTDNEAFAALDFETTGLDLRVAEIRLTTITGPSGTYVLDHRECGSFSTLAPKFLGLTRWVVFNIGFEGRGFIHHLGSELSEEIKLLDVVFMRRAVEGGGWPFNLAQMVKVDLQIEMSKEEQAGAWDREVLTKGQYDYAAYDGYVTWELYKLWNQKMNSGHWHGCMIINSAWRANIEMEETGLPLDEPYHLAIIEVWRRKQQTAERYFRRYVGVDLIKNLNSNQQMSNFLKKELHPATIESWEKTGKTKDFLKNWRPITLLNTVYKIGSGCIAKRLKNVIPKLINEDQTGFLKGRFIGENTRLIYDLLSYTEEHNIPGMLLLIYFEKAFNS